MTGIGAQTTFAKKPSVVWRELDGESVLLDLDTGLYYSLNKVGTSAWKLLEDGEDLSSVVASVCASYEVSEEQAKADIWDLMENLISEGLLSPNA